MVKRNPAAKRLGLRGEGVTAGVGQRTMALKERPWPMDHATKSAAKATGSAVRSPAASTIMSKTPQSTAPTAKGRMSTVTNVQDTFSATTRLRNVAVRHAGHRSVRHAHAHEGRRHFCFQLRTLPTVTNSAMTTARKPTK